MFDSSMIENSFDDLLIAFSNQAISAFSSCLFFMAHGESNAFDSFEKFIYNKGNKREVYTKKERSIIEQISQYQVCSEFCMFENNHNILCRIIAIDLSFSNSLIYDSVATMKICNKAFDGFNVYILVGSSAVHIGCDILWDATKTDCMISYPIKKDIGWDALLYNFLEIVDDKGFVNYYYSLIDSISSVYTCYDMKSDLYPMPLELTDDYEEKWYDVSDESLYKENEEQEDDVFDSLRYFMSEVDDAKQDLSYIESNRINSLEMLFEAEVQMKKSDEVQAFYGSIEQSGNSQSEEFHSLLSDPEKLIKALKNRNQ